MTLAVVFLAISCTVAIPSAVARAQSDGQSTQTTTSQSTSEKKDQPNESQPQPAPATANPVASSPQTTGPQTQATTKHRVRKKKAASPNCAITPSTSESATASPNSTSSSTDPSVATQDSGNAQAANCPPVKVVVPHGGTTDPSIQLAGRPTTGQAAKQRDVVNQLLGVTEANLKKIAAQQLSSSQQDTLTQSRAFVKQSRDAVENGDLDRARTLAWKAELLSEDLLKPKE